MSKVCPACNGLMDRGSHLCVQCSAKVNAGRKHERWLEQHNAKMPPLHERFKARLAQGESIADLMELARRGEL